MIFPGVCTLCEPGLQGQYRLELGVDYQSCCKSGHQSLKTVETRVGQNKTLNSPGVSLIGSRVTRDSSSRDQNQDQQRRKFSLWYLLGLIPVYQTWNKWRLRQLQLSKFFTAFSSTAGYTGFIHDSILHKYNLTKKIIRNILGILLET